MTFYDDMAEMTRDLLKPAADGGFGQGSVQLTRMTVAAPNPLTPWDPVTPVPTKQTLNCGVSGVDRKLVGTELGGTVLLATDRVALCEVPAQAYQPGDILTVDGVGVNVIAVQNIPAAGTPAAVRFVIRG